MSVEDPFSEFHKAAAKEEAERKAKESVRITKQQQEQCIRDELSRQLSPIEERLAAIEFKLAKI